VVGNPELPDTTVETANGIVALRTARPTLVVGTLSGWAARAGVDELPELFVSRPTLEDG
jgi:hypothetical protein